mgnify:CR=1 FL=1
MHIGNDWDVILKDIFEIDDSLYIYIDFNGTGIYNIDIPDKYMGRDVIIHEHSSNITLLTPISSSKISIKVDTSDPMYGYFVAKIKSV